ELRSFAFWRHAKWDSRPYRPEISLRGRSRGQGCGQRVRAAHGELRASVGHHWGELALADRHCGFVFVEPELDARGPARSPILRAVGRESGRWLVSVSDTRPVARQANRQDILPPE